MSIRTLIASLVVISGCSAPAANTRDLTVTFGRADEPAPERLYVCGDVGGRFTCVDYVDFLRALEAAGGSAGPDLDTSRRTL